MAANNEVVVRREGILKWKSDKGSAAVKTVGFALGGIKLSITRYRQEVLNNDGTFSHWKQTRDPEVSISVSKLFQDVATDLLSDSSNGFNAAVSGQTVPTGTLSFESTKADGTLDIIRVSKAVFLTNNRSQADAGDTHELTFKAIGEPDYSQTTTLS